MVAIRQLLTDSPFHGEGYRKLWARLRFAGMRTSRRRVLRLMHGHGLLAHQRAGCPHGSRAHDGRITTGRIDVMRGSDLTSVMGRRWTPSRRAGPSRQTEEIPFSASGENPGSGALLVQAKQGEGYDVLEKEEGFGPASPHAASAQPGGT